MSSMWLAYSTENTLLVEYVWAPEINQRDFISIIF